MLTSHPVSEYTILEYYNVHSEGTNANEYLIKFSLYNLFNDSSMLLIVLTEYLKFLMN